MGKRILLFLVTNALVVLMASLIMNFVLPMFGVDVRSEVAFLAVFCGVFGMSGAIVSLLISRWVAYRVYGVQRVAPKRGGMDLQLYRMVEDLTRSAGIPMPHVGVYDSPEPNAFATGPSKNKSLIAFSTGLLRLMDERELRAVAAHEVSHIANGDMVTMTLLTGIANAFVMFAARIIAGLLDSVLGGDDGPGLGFFGYIIVVMLLETVFMALASIPLAAFSRHREYRADAGAAQLHGSQAMAAALRKLQAISLGPQRKEKRDSYSMAKISSKRRAMLFATHPPLEKRIARLTGQA